MTPLRRWFFLGFALLALISAAWWFWGKDEVLKVPLGVEQAAIVTYSGPKLVVKPFRYGVAVNMRIAQVTEQVGVSVYDIRYLVNHQGEHNLIDYLMLENGNLSIGLPSFKVLGDPKLSKELETRVQETEQIEIEVFSHYREVLIGLGIFWLLWLWALIFWRRPKKPSQAILESPLTVGAQINKLLNDLEQQGLNAEQKARLEMLILRYWREELGSPANTMAEVLASIARQPDTAEALSKLQRWLHHPKSDIAEVEISQIFRHQLHRVSESATL